MFRPIHALLAVAPLGLLACADRGVNDDRDFSYMEPGASVAAAPASQPAQQQQKKEITRFADENRDGRVTREEAKVDKALARSFDKYDDNKSGDLDRAEFARLEADHRDRTRTPSRASVVNEPAGPRGVETSPDRAPAGAPHSALNRTGIDEIRPATE